MRIQNYSLSGPVPKSYRIALIADLHDVDGSGVLSALQEKKPDIIAIAGDLTNNRRKRPVTFPDFLRSCAAVAPCFYSLGNHEFSFTDYERKLVWDSGAVLLVDEYVKLDSLVIGGLCSRTRYSILAGKRVSIPPQLEWLSDFEAQPGYKILLNHHPEYYEPYLKERSVDLILSGHAHGGQIRLLDRGLFAPGQGILPKYTKGVHDGRFIISAGLANTVPLVPRFGNPTELVYITVKPQT